MFHKGVTMTEIADLIQKMYGHQFDKIYIYSSESHKSDKFSVNNLSLNKTLTFKNLQQQSYVNLNVM